MSYIDSLYCDRPVKGLTAPIWIKCNLGFLLRRDRSNHFYLGADSGYYYLPILLWTTDWKRLLIRCFLIARQTSLSLKRNKTRLLSPIYTLAPNRSQISFALSPSNSSHPELSSLRSASSSSPSRLRSSCLAFHALKFLSVPKRVSQPETEYIPAFW